MQILISTSATRVIGVPADVYLHLLKDKRAAYDRQASDAQRTGDREEAEDLRRESGSVAQLMDKITSAQAAVAKAESSLNLLLDQAAEYVTPTKPARGD